MPPKAEQLRAFDAVARYRSVTQAARALGLSQPALSRQLAQLQEALGRPLYRRTATGVDLTPFGEALLPHARAVSEALERAQRFLQGEHPERVTLRVGLSHHLVTAYTVRLLRNLRAASAAGAELSVHMSEGYSQQLLDAVAQRALDAALVLGDAQDLPDALVARRISEEPLCLLVKPDDPLAAQALVPSSALHGETLVLPASVSWLHGRLQRYLASALITPGRVIEVSGPFAVRCAVLEGLGIGVSVRSFVQAEVDAALLRTVGFEADGFIAGVQLVTRAPDTYDRAAWTALSTLVP
ncbi:LysR family transcriptional regulator [Truepera radiovictrix]|uniref:Transcriptional regulator, LysR family n=1 Tax=Truepera radiovictrix (strain DSM 17093 / CIP 108686 / LMG 22925 / RQ-24) TaxID=649638 RepID=D7CWG9_TRURR|nr:LysR family transcriptional regulator [Truepera radiovictrix]ADI14368.1 transcriptional regulator, LysR family [Truepera radiovictrix DSM 17093]WMT57075.1 LysR family transcriptional regulator [Truepera radiovictrix]